MRKNVKKILYRKSKKNPSPINECKNQKSRLGAKIELITELPPSTNKLYRRIRGGGLALSETAKSFALRLKKVIAEHTADIALFPVGPELTYQIDITLYFDKLENPGWFEVADRDTHYTKDTKSGNKKGDIKLKKGDRNAVTRFKRIDYDNRIKFLQDRIAEMLGIDDSQIFRSLQEKLESPSNPRAKVVVKLIDPDQFFSERVF